MKPIFTKKQARELLRFGTVPGAPKRGTRFFFKGTGTPWEEATAHGGRGDKGLYHLQWCTTVGGYAMTLMNLPDLVHIISLGPEQVSKILEEGFRQTVKNLGVRDAILRER